MKFEDIISYDFEKDYKIPEYIIPNEVLKELEKENNNINNNNLKEVNNIIKNNEEEGALVEAESVKEKEDENDDIDDLKEIGYDDDDKQYNDFEG